MTLLGKKEWLKGVEWASIFTHFDVHSSCKPRAFHPEGGVRANEETSGTGWTSWQEACGASHLQPTDRLNPVGILQAKTVSSWIYASKIWTIKLTMKERENKNANINIIRETFIVFPYSHWYGNCYFPSLCCWRAESLWSVRCAFERKWFWTDASGQPTSPPHTASKRSSSRFSSNRGTATEYWAEGTGSVSHRNTRSLSPYGSLPLSGIIIHTCGGAQASQIA